MEPKTKTFGAAFKALGPDDGEPVGSFEAVVAVFDNVDKVGDRIKSTAFDNTLEKWRKSGDPIPVILSHNWDDPFAIIGHADPNQVKAIEGRGLYVKGMIDHLEDNPVAAQVHRLMGSRLLKEFSFGYTVPAGGEKKAQDGAYDLLEINLIELGPTLKGVNPDTELLSLKSALSAHNRRKNYVDIEIEGTFEAIRDSLSAALASKYPQPNDTKSGWTSVDIVATTPTQVVYQVTAFGNGEKSDIMYSASYELDADGNATIGDPSEVEVEIVPKSEAYQELVDFALKYKVLYQEGAEAWAQKMVDTELPEDKAAMMAHHAYAGDGTEPCTVEGCGQAKGADIHMDPETGDPMMKTAKSDEEIEVKDDETPADPDENDHQIDMLRLEQAEHEIGKALTADAIEAAALNRQLAVELAQYEGDDA